MDVVFLQNFILIKNLIDGELAELLGKIYDPSLERTVHIFKLYTIINLATFNSCVVSSVISVNNLPMISTYDPP